MERSVIRVSPSRITLSLSSGRPTGSGLWPARWQAPPGPGGSIRATDSAFHDPQHVAHHAVELEVLRRIDGGDAGLPERGGIVGRNDAADDDRHVIKAGGPQAGHYVFDQRHVRARQD